MPACGRIFVLIHTLLSLEDEAPTLLLSLSFTCDGPQQKASGLAQLNIHATHHPPLLEIHQAAEVHRSCELSLKADEAHTFIALLSWSRTLGKLSRHSNQALCTKCDTYKLNDAKGALESRQGTCMAISASPGGIHGFQVESASRSTFAPSFLTRSAIARGVCNSQSPHQHSSPPSLLQATPHEVGT